MPPETLTAETILSTTEEVLRRYGPAKATVVDVARVLKVSHGSVYRHFPSKTALREAVAERWLRRAHVGLEELAAGDSPPPARLREWLAALFSAKRRKALDDPELFATFAALAREHSAIADAHIEAMVEQLARIIADGIASGDFHTSDPTASARAVWNATARFHDPVNAPTWAEPGVEAAFDAVCSLVVAGLRASQD